MRTQRLPQGWTGSPAVVVAVSSLARRRAENAARRGIKPAVCRVESDHCCWWGCVIVECVAGHVQVGTECVQRRRVKLGVSRLTETKITAGFRVDSLAGKSEMSQCVR